MAMGEISAINQFHFIFNLNFIEMLPPALLMGYFGKEEGNGSGNEVVKRAGGWIVLKSVCR